jgi:hypothetical protein
MSSNDLEVRELSEIYDALAACAKQIVDDFESGVRMWREAARIRATI